MGKSICMQEGNGVAGPRGNLECYEFEVTRINLPEGAIAVAYSRPDIVKPADSRKRNLGDAILLIKHRLLNGLLSFAGMMNDLGSVLSDHRRFPFLRLLAGFGPFPFKDGV